MALAAVRQEWKAQITNAEYGHGLTMSMEEHYWTFEQLQVCTTSQDYSNCQALRRRVVFWISRASETQLPPGPLSLL